MEKNVKTTLGKLVKAKSGQEEVPSIPVMVDDVKEFKNFRMTRCTYFSIECDTPSAEWMMELKDREVPFYLFGLSGIIREPIGTKTAFDSPQAIDELFETIEKTPELFVDINDIWLPNFLFENTPTERGTVYRIKERLFLEADRFRDDRISVDRFLKICEELRDHISYSDTETESFKEWASSQIEMAKKVFPKNPDLELKYRTE